MFVLFNGDLVNIRHIFRIVKSASYSTGNNVIEYYTIDMTYQFDQENLGFSCEVFKNQESRDERFQELIEKLTN